jgi:hypothetical protein
MCRKQHLEHSLAVGEWSRASINRPLILYQRSNMSIGLRHVSVLCPMKLRVWHLRLWTRQCLGLVDHVKDRYNRKTQELVRCRHRGLSTLLDRKDFVAHVINISRAFALARRSSMALLSINSGALLHCRHRQLFIRGVIKAGVLHNGQRTCQAVSYHPLLAPSP